ncbi:Uncharacterised protein [Salmonella enterica subsp. arizonae]|uniref:Uncharacterized protein n=1 Tax=Salmonella enterica subsp. arizonae TaxID=59203 RepID=A0A2X4TIB3_SALER|nr:Uncharacterised protein [Salmonella enterica subsp. arizonae]
MRCLHSLIPVTYLCKLPEILELAAFLQLELFWGSYQALLFSFYEAFFRLGSQILRTAFTNGCSYSAQVQANSTDCVHRYPG